MSHLYRVPMSYVMNAVRKRFVHWLSLHPGVSQVACLTFQQAEKKTPPNNVTSKGEVFTSWVSVKHETMLGMFNKLWDLRSLNAYKVSLLLLILLFLCLVSVLAVSY